MSATLQQLRDAWIAAENARSEAWKAFMDANRASPLRQQLDEATQAEKRAKEAFAAAFQKNNIESHPDVPTTKKTA